MISKALIAAALISVPATFASAATMTYNVSGSFSGGNLGTVAYDVDITGEFISTNNTPPITVSAINSLTANSADLPLPDLTASFIVSRNELTLEYLNFGDPSIGTNLAFFSIKVSSFLGQPFIGVIQDAAGQGDGSTGTLGCYPVEACEGQIPITLENFAVTPLPDLPDVPDTPDMTPVPLPASVLLLSGGLLGLGALGRRRRRKT